MQSFLTVLENFKENYLAWVSVLNITVSKTDIVEMLIIAFLFYHVLKWIKDTRAWMLLKGILVILAFVLVAAIFQMNTILWIAEKTINVAIIAIVVIFQPELRKALEELGRKKFISSLFSFDFGKNGVERFNDHTIGELVKASYEMGKVKTGALIVVENEIMLTEYERTGIALDSLVSSQLLINIFEHNTPLHDGAIIVRGDRIVSATCYLPLSDNMGISKDLGTRHRAAVGMSEVSDALVITVSEETGAVSVAQGGELTRSINEAELRVKLEEVQHKSSETNRIKAMWKGWRKHAKKNN